MRVLLLFAIAAVLASAQPRDAAFQALDRAYTALRARDYDVAVPAFLAAIQAAPGRADIRKDLAYTYSRSVSPNWRATSFARRCGWIRPTPQPPWSTPSSATKPSSRPRRAASSTACGAPETPPPNRPSTISTTRWRRGSRAGRRRIELGADNFSAHFELATLAEQRDELALAATHFERAWRLLPDRRTVLVDLGRVWQAMGRTDDATAALLAASRGGEPRAAEMARELLPARYPFVSEFRQALALDPANHDLRRELGYLLLRMGRAKRGGSEFRILTAERAGRSALGHATGLPALRARREDRRHAAVRPRAGRAGRRSGQPRSRRPAHAAGAAPARREPRRRRSTPRSWRSAASRPGT